MDCCNCCSVLINWAKAESCVSSCGKASDAALVELLAVVLLELALPRSDCT